MITVSNYNEKKSNINWNDLPTAVRDNRSDVEGMLDLYGEDKTIDNMIDTFLTKINTKKTAVATAHNSKKVIKKPEPKKAKKANALIDKPGKAKKANAKKVKKVVDYKIVANFSEEFKLLRRFLNATKKETLTFKQVRLLYMAFNKAAVSRNVRKSSDKSDEFELANSAIAKIFDQSDNDHAKEHGIQLKIEDTNLIEELTAYVSGTKINYAITLLRSFISVQGTIPGKEKAERLLKRFTNAFKNDRLNDKNRLYDQVMDAIYELKEYLKSPKEPVDVEAFGLSVPKGTCSNRIKCEGLNSKGQLLHGYKFAKGGKVVKVNKKTKKKGLGIIASPKKKAKNKKVSSKPRKVKKKVIPASNVIPNVTRAAQKPLKVEQKPKKVAQKALKKPKKAPKAKKGLNIPVVSKDHSVPMASINTNVIPNPIDPRVKNLAAAMNDTNDNEVFNIPGDIGLFLGQVEKKPVHSVVTTIDAEQGSGKTRLVFQIINALAGMGMKCLFYSLEEHPQSKLFKDKVSQYIDPSNLANISVIDEVTNWEDEKALIEASDAIFFDSFQKLPKIDLDRDIRKAFNGKLFYVVYQQTGTKTMRGGSEAAFDGDQILKIKKHDNYKDNYAFANKNRYQEDPEIKFNIYRGKLVRDPKKDVEEFTNSRPPDNTGGRLIATPMF
jgi:hypothetical protein